jgi:hypothetical protein
MIKLLRVGLETIQPKQAVQKIPLVASTPCPLESLLVKPNLFNKFHFMDSKGQTYLYVDGDEYKVSKTLAKNLTQKAQVTIMATEPED